jgi:sigma-B regulation protein RsbU (phosphoserine phosphatase)
LSLAGRRGKGKFSIEFRAQETTLVFGGLDHARVVKLYLPLHPVARYWLVRNMLTVPSVVETRAIAKIRMEELEEARAIQNVMLPRESLCVGAVSIAHEFQPVVGVGGDFLDYFLLGDGRMGLYIGDVSGKGLPAAMYATLAVGILRGIHKTNERPNEVLAQMNKRLLSRGALRRHAATQYAVFDPKTSQMCIASAGMPGPVHYSGGHCSVVEVSGIPPGLFPDVQYESVSVTLKAGDSVLFCSDGILEAQNARYEDFGIERLIEICNIQGDRGPSEFLANIFSAVHEFSQPIQQHDDMAAAVFHLSAEK